MPRSKRSRIFLCKHCKRVGYRKHEDGIEVFIILNSKRKLLHKRSTDGFESRYNGKGRCMYSKTPYGETWYDEKGNVIKQVWTSNFYTKLTHQQQIYVSDIGRVKDDDKM